MGQIITILFDATGANTGRLNCACIVLCSNMLQKSLLWLACQHHNHEIFLKKCSKLYLTSISAICILILLRPRIQAVYEPCADHHLRNKLELLWNDMIDFLTHVLQQESDSKLREDYQELLEIARVWLWTEYWLWAEFLHMASDLGFLVHFVM